MSQHIDDFAKEIQEDILEFVSRYKGRHYLNSEVYPLELPTGQEGLWFEFFMGFCESGDV